MSASGLPGTVNRLSCNAVSAEYCRFLYRTAGPCLLSFVPTYTNHASVIFVFFLRGELTITTLLSPYMRVRTYSPHSLINPSGWFRIVLRSISADCSPHSCRFPDQASDDSSDRSCHQHCFVEIQWLLSFFPIPFYLGHNILNKCSFVKGKVRVITNYMNHRGHWESDGQMTGGQTDRQAGEE